MIWSATFSVERRGSISLATLRGVVQTFSKAKQYRQIATGLLPIISLPAANSNSCQSPPSSWLIRSTPIFATAVKIMFMRHPIQGASKLFDLQILSQFGNVPLPVSTPFELKYTCHRQTAKIFGTIEFVNVWRDRIHTRKLRQMLEFADLLTIRFPLRFQPNVPSCRSELMIEPWKWSGER